MENENQLSTEEFAALAVSDPVAWAKAYVEDNDMSDGPGEYGFHADYYHSLGGFILIQVDSEGGYEGGGESATVTYAIAPENGVVRNGRVDGAAAYVEFSGHYSSYDGTEWDHDGYVVYPKDVTVVQYHTTP